MNFNRLKDSISQWMRYPQPNWFQRNLLGLHTDSYDTEVQAKLIASRNSAQYIIDNMPDVTNYASDYDLHDAIQNEVSVNLASNGLILEFGVATGRTLNHWARLFPTQVIFGFDGFEGLPEDWGWRMKEGHFAQKLPNVANNCQLVVGWFDDTLPDFVKQHTAPIALLHLDADLYSSTDTVLKALKKQIVPGTVIVFDEYLNYPNWENHEYLAWQQFAKQHKVNYEYIGFVSKHQQVAVRVNKIG